LSIIDQLPICASLLPCSALSITFSSGTSKPFRTSPASLVNEFDEQDEAAAREKIGDKFPRHTYPAIVTTKHLEPE
jgi:hypothetical protein